LRFLTRDDLGRRVPMILRALCLFIEPYRNSPQRQRHSRASRAAHHKPGQNATQLSACPFMPPLG